MGQPLAFRVHYPCPAARSATVDSRCAPDWGADLEPSAVSADGTRFDLDLEGPFLYFKPVLRRGTEVIWEQCENSLVLASCAWGRDLWPYFFADDARSVRTLQRPPGIEGTHSVRVFPPPGYAENTLACYPVLYMQDGQNLFFARKPSAVSIGWWTRRCANSAP